MAPGDSKANNKQGKSAIESRSSKDQNARVPSGRGVILERKKKLRQRRSDRVNEQSSQEKELAKLKRKIENVEAQIKQAMDDGKRSEMETLMKDLLSERMKKESELKTIEADLMEIDSDINQLERGEPDKVVDSNIQQETGESEATDTPEHQSEIAGNSNPGIVQQTKDTGTTVTEIPTKESNMHSADDNKGNDVNDVNEVNEVNDVNEINEVNELFASQTQPLDSKRSPNTESVQEQPLNNQNNKLPSDGETGRRPKDFADFIYDLTQDDDSPSFSLEDGTVLLKARGGKLSLNSYGPRNSPMFIWSTSPASYRVKKVTNLLGKPHKQAMERDDETDSLVYKGKIGPIKAVAWLPRNGGDSMLGLLDSVEELNPSNKERDSNYRYPFSTVLVDLEGGEEQMQSVWIDRSKYKSLSSAGKDSSKRTDRKFYEKACTQVKNFRDWAGKALDIDWKGKAREGRDDRSPTPLEETPEPEDIAQNTPRKKILAQAASSPADSSPATSSPATSSLATSHISDSNQASVKSNDISGEKSSLPRNSKPTTSEGDDEEDRAVISEFYEALLEKWGVDSTIPWKELSDTLFAQFQAAAKIYIRDLKKQNMRVEDDMNFGRAFKKGTFYTPAISAN
ncbi:uncharacterized protein N7496_006034 [Penicillium cataractarum]|uniref:Uncharacterized protein n=1 Tax=Penicillium cataractarum TaxID=2100454 RepID=A0A9W9V5Y9_9EURO|nr:uncharacterized protein N7496_006034 [Penicillium cataractarum]KAJ5369942.1 hypothetical protein N7496_006034 [Penicillium cataractarum]